MAVCGSTTSFCQIFSQNSTRTGTWAEILGENLGKMWNTLSMATYYYNALDNLTLHRRDITVRVWKSRECEGKKKTVVGVANSHLHNREVRHSLSKTNTYETRLLSGLRRWTPVTLALVLADLSWYFPLPTSAFRYPDYGPRSRA